MGEVFKVRGADGSTSVEQIGSEYPEVGLDVAEGAWHAWMRKTVAMTW